MESQTSKKAEEIRKQAELRQQIALLQKQIIDVPELDQPILRLSPKRKQPEQSILAPATPSPKKKRKLSHPHDSTRLQPQQSRVIASRKQQTQSNTSTAIAPPKAPSNFVAKLATLTTRPVENETIADRVQRSSGFTEKPAPAPTALTTPDEDVFGGQEDKGVKRDDRLAIIEELLPGPYDHKPPFDDPNFQHYEPHSSIRLSSRNIPHDEFQDYLRGRYYLPPSLLYSVIRLLPNKQGYDVPVEGDWITIAVVAERGPIKFSRAPVGIGREEEDQKGPKGKQHANNKKKQEPEKPNGKKYVNLKLIDFGCRTQSSSSSNTGGQAKIRGDAFLTLLLFESDGFDTITNGDSTRGQKLYKGGSKGAFESMAKLREGAVVALLNPKILKPFQRANDSPHPVNNILALTPESASSIAVIGYAKDLGMCTVEKRDGKPCGGWVDKRTSEVCEWHVQNAVERRRAGRAEFSSGTSGMSMSAASKKRSAYDPARQWGLKPEESAGATYIVSGHVISGSASDSKSLYVGETIGREAQAKASRVSTKEADRALKALLEKDKDGMRTVIKAREVGSKEKDAGAKGKGKGARETPKTPTVPPPPMQKNAYSADVIKKLGFDPTGRIGIKDDTEVKKKLESLALATASRPIELGPRPGRLRSCVSAPSKDDPPPTAPVPDPVLGRKEDMVDLDSSDVE